MSTTQEVSDRLIRNDHFVEEYKNNISDGFTYEYERFLRRIRRIMQSEFGNRLTVRRQNELKKEIEDEIDQYLERLRDLSEEELRDFQETYFNAINKVVEDIDSDKAIDQEFTPIRGYMSKNHPIENGKVINVQAMITSIGVALYEDLGNIISRMGVVDEDVKTLGNYYDKATRKGENNTRTVGVTAVALVAGLTRDTYNRRNRNVIGHQHISVLDAATTDICQFRHSKVWYYDDRLSHLSTLPDSAGVPLHHNCRSITVPIFRGEDPVAEEGYQEWFERQDAATKREILGPTRYELYKNRDLTIETFKDVQGNMLTLDELRRKIN